MPVKTNMGIFINPKPEYRNFRPRPGPPEKLIGPRTSEAMRTLAEMLSGAPGRAETNSNDQNSNDQNELENASADEEVSGREVRVRCEMDSEAAEACIVSRCRHVSHVGVATAELLQLFERELSC